jgi:hypothetical protein
MEIFITDQHVQFIIGYGIGNFGLAFLKAPSISPEGGGNGGDGSEDFLHYEVRE